MIDDNDAIAIDNRINITTQFGKQTTANDDVEAGKTHNSLKFPRQVQLQPLHAFQCLPRASLTIDFTTYNTVCAFTERCHSHDFGVLLRCVLFCVCVYRCQSFKKRCYSFLPFLRLFLLLFHVVVICLIMNTKLIMNVDNMNA